MSISVTFTGIDKHTDLSLLPTGCEYGILCTMNPEGRNRYPEFHEIMEILEKLEHHKTALHICGGEAKRMFYTGGLWPMVDRVDRVQINGHVTEDNLKTACTLNPNTTIITQHILENHNLIGVNEKRHAILVDNSGGRGITPGAWLRPETNKCVGFAGGLGPHNIVDQLEKINKVAARGSWIDMENNVRDDNDWFDVEKCNEVMSKIISPTGSNFDDFLKEEGIYDEVVEAAQKEIDKLEQEDGK